MKNQIGIMSLAVIISMSAQAGNHTANGFIVSLIQNSSHVRDEIWRKGDKNIEGYSFNYVLGTTEVENRINGYGSTQSLEDTIALEATSENSDWQCAGLTKAVSDSNIGGTRSWSTMNNNSDITKHDDYRQFKLGDIIATFDDTNSYKGHTAIVFRSQSNDAWVLDQNWLHYSDLGIKYGAVTPYGGPMTLHFIDNQGNNIANINNYSRIYK